MAKQKIPFSQHVTLMILSVLLLGLISLFIKLKKISPQLRDIRDSLDEATRERDFAKSKKREVIEDPKKFEQQLEEILTDKKNLEKQLQNLKSVKLTKSNQAKVQNTLLEIMTIAKKMKLKIIEQKALQNQTRNNFSCHFLCHYENLPIFIDTLSQLSTPVIFDKLTVSNKENHLDVILEFSL